MDRFFLVFFEFVTILLLFYVLGGFWPQDMQDLSFLTRDWTTAPGLVDEVLTTGLSESSLVLLFFDFYYQSDFSFINDLGGEFPC